MLASEGEQYRQEEMVDWRSVLYLELSDSHCWTDKGMNDR